jgi:S-methylmethionine-dependent homocysteine/selenocysteine methylase
LQVKDLYASPLVLTDGAGESSDAYLDVAQRYSLPIQVGAVNADAVAALRRSIERVTVPVLIAGVVDSSSGVRAFAGTGIDMLYAQSSASLSELGEVVQAMAETKTPFAVAPQLQENGTMPDGTTLAEAIERLDADPSMRPWHYMLSCLTSAAAQTALESLFRAAPGLAHRVIGLKADASGESPDEFARGVWECAERFGLHVLGGCRNANAAEIDAIAASAPQRR